MAADRWRLSAGRADLGLAPVADAFEREVTASPQQFERELRKAWPAGVETLAPGRFRVREGETRLDIETESHGVRQLGLFELPVVVVRYRFAGGDPATRRALLAALDRAMQRGGG